MADTTLYPHVLSVTLVFATAHTGATSGVNIMAGAAITAGRVAPGRDGVVTVTAEVAVAVEVGTGSVGVLECSIRGECRTSVVLGGRRCSPTRDGAVKLDLGGDVARICPAAAVGDTVCGSGAVTDAALDDVSVGRSTTDRGDVVLTFS